MKKIIFTSVFALGVSLIAAPAFAAGILMPFGGKITTVIAGVACSDGKPPFTIMPAGPSAGGPFGGTASALIGFPTEVIAPGIWVLGLYLPTPLPICFTTSVPPVPVLAMPVYVIGTSKTPSL